jgi:DNA-binding response OmpR family regulator
MSHHQDDISTKTILIVEDDEQYRALLLEALNIKKFRVLAASNGNEGLRMFKDHYPDLIISDIVLPEKEGLELIWEIRKLSSDVKIIAISGGGVGEARIYLDTAMKFGADRTFEKPFIVFELLYEVASLLQEKK